MDATSALLISGFVLLIYLPVAVIFWKNVRLSQPWKAMFSLTVCPVFIVSMGLNIALMRGYGGWLIEPLVSSRALGQSRFGGIVALLETTPIAVLICFVWYGLMRALDSVFGRKKKA